MAATKQATKNSITLKGSAEMVTEFFKYGINSILYQRGIYPAETFTRESKYGLTVLVTTDELLNTYLSGVLKQLRDWLLGKTVQKLVLVVTDIDTNEVLERWQFNIECDKTMTEDSKPRKAVEEDIIKGIKAVIRQITASVTFLPLLEGATVFDLLIYTDRDAETPLEWEESGPQLIPQGREVRLRSFSTTIHKVDAMVAYKGDQ
ncbi:mitotic spindle assembly checkpoint protein MAD2A-like [Saccoglossus kowalevskii]|uniref:Mitotic spindle assembly checkpoint protein MAD2A-like n=1 Tax=Saccoglossus kowalevskii TaxID=10224 RepID=A0ABM0GR20_SACKO|nr:PREDICTED: mitotic spindle assembly checkpoint protein MAD2A-like [Saccoglossus kowalevskii]